MGGSSAASVDGFTVDGFTVDEVTADEVTVDGVLWMAFCGRRSVDRAQ